MNFDLLCMQAAMELYSSMQAASSALDNSNSLDWFCERRRVLF